MRHQNHPTVCALNENTTLHIPQHIHRIEIQINTRKIVRTQFWQDHETKWNWEWVTRTSTQIFFLASRPTLRYSAMLRMHFFYLASKFYIFEQIVIMVTILALKVHTFRWRCSSWCIGLRWGLKWLKRQWRIYDIDVNANYITVDSTHS